MSDPILVSSGIPNLLPMQGRSPGLHVSDVIHDLCIKRGMYKPSPANMTKLQLGCALEHALAHRYSQQFPHQYFQPGEMIGRSGLPGTPDMARTSMSPDEIKLTWISSNHDILSDKFIKFWWQVGYYGSDEILNNELTRLHLCHVNGDYRNSGPIYNVWERRWSKLEMTQNRDMLLRHRDLMESGKSASLERFAEIVRP